MAIASQGGHLVQLMRLKPLFDRHDTIYVTSGIDKSEKGMHRFRVIDANYDKKFQLFVQFMQVLYVVLKNKPEAIITTGASAGVFAVVVGHFLGTKTIWIDSIANADCISRSGLIARRFSGLWLTQWQHLARQDGPIYIGSVL